MIYAVIPKEILCSKYLTNTEKIMFAYIVMINNFEEFCLTNEEIAKDLKMSIRTISHTINSLIKKKLIKSEMVYKENTKYIIKRKIKLNIRII